MKRLQDFTFEGHALTVVNYNGRPAWVAREVGAALGYARDGIGLSDKLNSDWADEIQEGGDYVKLVGPELAAFKDAMRLVGDSPTSENTPSTGRWPSALLLFESGLHGILLLSRQPLAKAMRRWLREEVLPQLVRDGHYSPGRHVDGQGQLHGQVTAAPLALEVRPATTAAELKMRVGYLLQIAGQLHDPRYTEAAGALLAQGVVPQTASNASKREAVARALSEQGDRGNRELARELGVSHTYVGTMRQERQDRLRRELAQAMERDPMLELEPVPVPVPERPPAHSFVSQPLSEAARDRPASKPVLPLRENEVERLRQFLAEHASFWISEAARAAWGPSYKPDAAHIRPVAMFLESLGVTKEAVTSWNGKPAYRWTRPLQ